MQKTKNKEKMYDRQWFWSQRVNMIDVTYLFLNMQEFQAI